MDRAVMMSPTASRMRAALTMAAITAIAVSFSDILGSSGTVWSRFKLAPIGASRFYSLVVS